MIGGKAYTSSCIIIQLVCDNGNHSVEYANL